DTYVDGPLAEVQVAEEEAVSLAGDAPQEGDPPVDQRVREDGRQERRPAREPDEREVEPHRLGDRELVAPLARPVVVDALALAAVLEAVLEGVRIEPAERPGDAGARGGEALDVVVELQLEEIAVLADVPRRGAREGEGVVRAPLLLGADPHVGVGSHEEPHLAAVVEGDGSCHGARGREEGGGRPGRDTNSPRTISSGCRRKGPSWTSRYAIPCTTVCASAYRSGKSGSSAGWTPSSSETSRHAPASNDSPAASTPPTATSQCPG